MDYLSLLNGRSYDDAVSYAVAVRMNTPTNILNEEALKDEIHGLYLRLALRDKMYKLPLIEEFIRNSSTDAYNEIAPFEEHVTEWTKYSIVAQKIKMVLLSKYSTLIPGLNRLLLVPEPLPEIRSHLGGMQEFVDSIRYSLATENWLSALFMALALPDICAAVEHGRTTGVRYEDWFNRYLKKKYNPENQLELIEARYPLMIRGWSKEQLNQAKQPDSRMARWRFTAADCYQFRCKTLHQGLSQRAKDDSNKIHFSPPTGATFHQTVIGTQWWLSIDIGCNPNCR